MRRVRRRQTAARAKAWMKSCPLSPLAGCVNGRGAGPAPATPFHEFTYILYRVNRDLAEPLWLGGHSAAPLSRALFPAKWRRAFQAGGFEHRGGGVARAQQHPADGAGRFVHAIGAAVIGR